MAITLNDFSVNWIAAFIKEATNNPATKKAGAMTQGISLINITIESIFNFNLRRQEWSHGSIFLFSKRANSPATKLFPSLASEKAQWLNHYVIRKPRDHLKTRFIIFFRIMRRTILSLSEKVNHILILTYWHSV